MTGYTEYEIRKIEGTNAHVRFYQVMASSAYIVQMIFNAGKNDRRCKIRESRLIVCSSFDREAAYLAYSSQTATN